MNPFNAAPRLSAGLIDFHTHDTLGAAWLFNVLIRADWYGRPHRLPTSGLAAFAGLLLLGIVAGGCRTERI